MILAKSLARWHGVLDESREANIGFMGFTVKQNRRFTHMTMK